MKIELCTEQERCKKFCKIQQKEGISSYKEVLSMIALSNTVYSCMEDTSVVQLLSGHLLSSEMKK